MYSVETNDFDTFKLLVDTLENYKKAKELIDKSTEFLETEKFKMGDYVTVDMPKALNISPNEIGRIVGWDFKCNFYRIYLSEDRSYVGLREKFLEPCNSKPKSLENVNALDLTFKNLMK